MRRGAPRIRSAGSAPVTNAGVDASHNRFYGAAYTLAGSATGVGPITYEWTKVSGTPVPTFADDTDPGSDVTFVGVGAVTLDLAATNAFGTSHDQVIITVTEAGAMDAVADSFAGLFSFNERLLASYTGPLFRVRRASDNAEQDIGYVAATNLRDTAALASFCSGTNGFVVTIYDQSGNGRHLTQATTTKQPKIYDSATGLVTLGPNGAAAALFDNVNDELTRADGFGMTGDVAWSAGAVWSTANTTGFAASWWIGSTSTRVLMRQNNNSTQLTMNYNNGARVHTSPNLTTGPNNTRTRRAAASTIGAIPLTHNGVDLTELSSTNPSNVPQTANTVSSVGQSTGGGSGALNGKWAGGFVSAVRWSDASCAVWDAWSTARYGT